MRWIIGIFCLMLLMSLTPQEESFAQTLRPMHRKVFVDRFSAEERAEAITMSQDESLSPDQAVEMVLKMQKNAQGSPQSGTGSPTQSSGSTRK